MNLNDLRAAFTGLTGTNRPIRLRLAKGKGLPVVAIVSAIAIFAFTEILGEGKGPTVVERKLPATLVDSAPSAAIAESSPTSGCAAGAALFNANAEFVSKNSDAIDLLVEQAYIDPLKVARAAESNPLAYIAIFKLVASCYPQLMYPGSAPKDMPNSCPKAGLTLHDHPISLLGRAAQLGAVEAKISYLLNAKRFATYLRRRGSDADVSEANRIISQAELLGTQAVQEGSFEASRYMSAVYENGLFGKRDPELALAFLLPLNKSSQDADLQRIQELSRTLSADQRSRAYTRAFGCDRESTQSTTTSPF